MKTKPKRPTPAQMRALMHKFHRHGFDHGQRYTFACSVLGRNAALPPITRIEAQQILYALDALDEALS